MSVVGTERAMSSVGLGRTLRALRDPLLLFAVPVAFALLLAFVGYGNSWPIGFDFRGTLWEPARALLPVTVAAWIWLCVLGVAMFGSMWILGVRDWRCLVLAVTSPVVVHGLFYGNLTVFLVLPLALAWRYRDKAWIAGVAVGAAVAAKLFVWPLVVWLLLTRRYRAAAWAAGSAALIVLGAWALVGFQGLRDYLTLLRAVQDVYAVRSLSLSTVAGSLGASVSAAVAVAALAGLACLGLAAWLVRRDDGDRRAFAIVVAACILSSPIVWPNYAALLFVPIAIRWPRLAPAWFFGYAVWLAGALAPDRVAVNIGPPPAGVVEQAWLWSHATPTGWFAAAMCLVVGAVGLTAALSRRHR